MQKVPIRMPFSGGEISIEDLFQGRENGFLRFPSRKNRLRIMEPGGRDALPDPLAHPPQDHRGLLNYLSMP